MSAERLRLGLVQMTSGPDLAANLAEVERLVRAARGADLIVFPENTLCLRATARDVPQCPGVGDVGRLEALATAERIHILLTTPWAEAGGVVNATLLFQPGRPAEVVYRKIHLFDVRVRGAAPVKESAVFTAGRTPALITVMGWRLGLSICYDLRFAELFRAYGQTADVILVPAAFLVPTGRAHWHVLLRARAIEAQAFVIAPAQVNAPGAERELFGHALAVDPWGEVMVDLGRASEVRVVELDRRRIAEVRAQIPMADHRRLC